MVRVFWGNEIPLSPFYLLFNLLFTSISPLFNLFFSFFNLNLTSASPRMFGNHGLQTLGMLRPRSRRAHSSPIFISSEILEPSSECIQDQRTIPNEQVSSSKRKVPAHARAPLESRLSSSLALPYARIECVHRKS